MPFDSEKQRRFLWANKPEVAKQIAYKNEGGEMMDGRKPSKVIKKDRYGNQITFEYEPEIKPLDQTAIVKHMMDQDIPEVDMSMDHPGEPMGSDTVPAWLTPGEFVVNAEAMRIPGAQEVIEDINDQGRAMQQMQGGSIPSMGYNNGGPVYKQGGGFNFLTPTPSIDKFYGHDIGGGNTQNAWQRINNEYTGSDGTTYQETPSYAVGHTAPGYQIIGTDASGNQQVVDPYGNLTINPAPVINNNITKEDIEQAYSGGTSSGTGSILESILKDLPDSSEKKTTKKKKSKSAPKEFVNENRDTRFDAAKELNKRGLSGKSNKTFNFGNLFKSAPKNETAVQVPDYRPNSNNPLSALGALFKQEGGNVPFIAGPRLNAEYLDDGGWITDDLLDRLREVESGGNNDAVSKAGAIGAYQWLPSSAKQAGYGVKAFDPKDEKAARKATAQYLKNMQKHHGFTPEETLRAYNWGPGNVIKHKKGKRKDIPAEALNYPGKILGFDKVEGVPAPKGMPVPTARPEGLGIPEAMPTPRPVTSPEAAIKDNESFLSSLWDMIKGPRYKDDGGSIYPDPIMNIANQNQSNVVPALTDVPKGHQMFGGNQNIAGDVVSQGPEPYEEPWYSGLLGHKSKEALNIPLDENEQRLANEDYKEYHAFNPSLVGDDPAVAENVESVEDDIVKDAMDSAVENNMVDEIKTDDFKKGTVAGEITDEVALNDAKKTGEVQTGPDKNQPGENKSEEEVVTKGESASKGVLDAAKNSLVSAFGDLFDSKELARMGILYAGSRLLGYSHGGSLQYAAKQYLTRVDAKAAGHDKYVKELTKSGKYSTKSIAAYNKSKDINDLVPVGTPLNPTGQFKTFYGPNGKQVRAQQVKAGKSTYWMKPDGTKINSSYTEDASAVRGTKEYGERVKKDTSLYTNMIKDLRSQFGTTPVEGGKDLYATELAPTIAGGKIAKWAADNNIPAEYMGSIVENAYHSALTHGKDTGEKVRDLTPFLEEQWVISQVGDSTLFKNKDGGQISGTNVSNLISQIQNAAARKGKSQDTPTLIAAYRKGWNALDPKEQDLWNAKATENENGFMKYVQNDITKSVM